MESIYNDVMHPSDLKCNTVRTQGKMQEDDVHMKTETFATQNLSLYFNFQKPIIV
jgi:hypothetical protein